MTCNLELHAIAIKCWFGMWQPHVISLTTGMQSVKTHISNHMKPC